MTNIKANTKQSHNATANNKQIANTSVIANAVKQSHDANDNNKQIASAKEPRNDDANQPSLRGGTTKQSVALKPKLRFKEFEGEWDKKKLGSLGEFKGGGTPSTENINYWNGNIPWVSSSDINEGDVINLNISKYLTEEAISESATKIIPKNSVLFVARVGVGKLAVTKEEICTSQDFANLIPNKADSYFVAYNFMARNKLLHSYSQGTSIKGFTMGDLKSIPINLPKLPEQQKIANFLTAVDTKLQQLTTKKETLAQYKKGVMQQLFPSTSSGQVAQLRFKPDNVTNVNVTASNHENVIARTQDEAISPNETQFPDWEEKRLGEVTSLLKDGTHGTHKDDPNGKYLLLSAKNIRNGKINTDSDDRKISEKEHNSIYKNYHLQENDILLSIVGTIGRVAKYRKEEKVAFQRSVAFFRFEKYDSEFMYQLMLEINFQKELDKRKVISAQPGIYLGDLAKIPLKIPSLKEQQKIATYLSAIDLKIEAVQTQLTHTQQFKKGLLQQLFV